MRHNLTLIALVFGVLLSITHAASAYPTAIDQAYAASLVPPVANLVCLQTNDATPQDNDQSPQQ